MVAVVVMVDDGSSVPCRSMVVAIDYGKVMVRQRWPAQQEGEARGQGGNARRGNATTSQYNERTRGWCNKRTMRDDDATTSWRDEMMRGRHVTMTRR